jgi:hypothetical protein
MILHIDLTVSPPNIHLQELDELRKLHVSVLGDPEVQGEALERVLQSEDLGYTSGTEHIYLSVDALKQRANWAVASADWREDFAAMVDFAKSRGWTADNGESLQSHVEWQQPG